MFGVRKWTIVRLVRLVAGYFLYVVGYFLYVVGYFFVCRGILLVCRGILPLCRGILFVCRGILLDVVTHAAAHKHEEVEWFWHQREMPCQQPFQLNWLTGSMAGKVLEKISFLLNDLERNSSGGNEDKQNEDVESVMARLYPSGRGQGGKRKGLKHVRAHAAADAIFFIRIKKISLVYV